MKHNGFTAAAVILLALLVADTRSADAMQTAATQTNATQTAATQTAAPSFHQTLLTRDGAAAGHIAESPLMKAVQSSAVYRSKEKITLFEDNLNWINETRTTSEYEAGLLVKRHEDVWEGHVFGDWQPFMHYEFTYGLDGTIASETVFEWDSADWRPFERTLYEGANGLFTRILIQAPDGGGGWVDVEQTTYTLENNLVVAGQTDLWLGEWTPSERFTYEESGNSVIETTQMPNGDEWINSERAIYPGLSLYYLHEEFERLLNDFSELEGMYYAIRLPELITQNWNGAEWVNELRIDTNASYELFTGYKIDETILADEWSGAEWVPVSRTFIEFATTHELHGLPSKLSIQFHDGSGWVEIGAEHYILQNGVRKIAQSTLSMDFGGGMEEVSRVRLEWTDVTSVGVENPETPATFVLDQNFPNPFNPSTRISYTLTEGQAVQLSVYDMLGRRVEVLESGFRPVGEHAVTWDASAVPSGMYVYRLETSDGVATRTMVLMK